MTTPRKSSATAEPVRDLNTVEAEWRGHTITLPASLDDSPMSVLVALEDGKVARALTALLGEAQLKRLDEKEMLTVGDLTELSDVVAVAMGFADAGE